MALPSQYNGRALVAGVRFRLVDGGGSGVMPGVPHCIVYCCTSSREVVYSLPGLAAAAQSRVRFLAFVSPSGE